MSTNKHGEGFENTVSLTNEQLNRELQKRINLSLEMHTLAKEALEEAKGIEVNSIDSTALMAKMQKSGDLKSLMQEKGRQIAGLEATLAAAASILESNAKIVTAEATLASIHAMETGVPAKSLLEFRKDITDFFLAMAKSNKDSTMMALAKAMQTKIDLDFIGQQDNRTNLGGVHRLEGDVVVGDQDNSVDNSVKER